MILAAALQECRNELICDLAQTYQIYDFRKMPAHLIATLTAGLGPDSRVMKKMTGRKYSIDTLILAMICDAVNLLVWMRTKDGEKNRNRPKSLHEALVEESKPKEDLMKFDSAEEFERYREKMLKG